MGPKWDRHEMGRLQLGLTPNGTLGPEMGWARNGTGPKWDGSEMGHLDPKWDGPEVGRVRNGTLGPEMGWARSGTGPKRPGPKRPDPKRPDPKRPGPKRPGPEWVCPKWPGPKWDRPHLYLVFFNKNSDFFQASNLCHGNLGKISENNGIIFNTSRNLL